LLLEPLNLPYFMNPVNPQKISERQTKINGLNINYKTIGDGKTPIVLLHGWGVSSDKYLELAKKLNIQYPISNIVIPDLPGFGKSEEPKENWNLNDYVGFVDEFIKRVNKKSGFELVKNILKKKLEQRKQYGNMYYHTDKEIKTKQSKQYGNMYYHTKTKTENVSKKIILIGHSFGGRIAIKYAAKYPEKIDKLILTGAAGIKHKLTVKQKALFILTKIGKVFFSLPVINHFQKPVYNIFSKIARSRKKDYYNASPRMKEIMKNVLVEDLTDYLGKIKTPTLLVWGKEDKTTPLADGEIMKFKIQNSKLKVIEDANHSLPYQKAEEFADIVGKFIK